MEPTNRELKLMIDNVVQKLEEKEKDSAEKHKATMDILTEIKDDVKATKEQATLTNGKVAKLYWWKNGFVWAMGALWTVILIAVPIGYMVLRYVVLNEIRVTVDQQFKDYKAIVEIND